jgi:type I restriction enzyme S subunit
MKLHELFPEISSNPASSKVIKQWILQLAVEGKLTKKWREENPNIDSSDLLKKINIEKTDLIKSKKIKKETFDALQYDDLIDIPKNWIWLRLGEIGFIFNGDSINATVKEQRYTNIEEGYPYVSTKDVGYGFEDIDLYNGVKIPKDEPKFKLARKNTILICAEGGSAGKKMGIITEESCFGNKLFAIHEFGGISSKFILIFYGSVFFQNEFQSRMSGIIGGISRNKFSEIPICIPPLEEQQAIVSIVEELFKEVDTLSQQATEHIALKRSYAQATLQRLCEADTFEEWQQIVSVFPEIFNDKQTIKTLRETILQLAVQGKLTAKWRQLNPNIEEASNLLNSIKKEKELLVKQKKIKNQKKLSDVKTNEFPFPIAKSWVWCRWNDLLSFAEYPMKRGPFGSALRKDDFVDEGIRVFEQYNPINDDPHWMRYFITPEKYEGLKAFATTAGDLLISCSGATLGRITELPLGVRSGIINQALLKITLHNELINNGYFKHLFRSSYIQKKIWTKALGSAIPNMVGVAELKEMLIPLPPIEEQRVIIDKVSSLMNMCDELEREVEKKQNLLSRII